MVPMGLQLHTRRWSDVDPLSDLDEEQMPTHIVWGESDSYRSIDQNSAELSGSRTGSDSQSSLRGGKKNLKKIKNKRLSRDDIEFRSSTSASGTGNSDGEPSSVSNGDSDNDAKRSNNMPSRQPQVEAMRVAACAMYAQNSPMPIEGDPEDADDSEELPAGPLPQQVVTKSNLSPEELEELARTVRRNDKGQLMSVGSTDHDTNCKPCLFVFTKVGCQNGLTCTFCHFKHKRGCRPRPCKGKRNRYRKLMEIMERNEGAQEQVGEQVATGSEEQRSDAS